MARLGMFVGPVILVLWIFCVIDVVASRDDEVRHLPKWGWLVLVLLEPETVVVATMMKPSAENTILFSMIAPLIFICLTALG